LLRDIETCSEAGQEMTVRILGRVFMEAWFVALYIHFGGYRALRRVAQNTAHHVGLVDRSLKDFDALIERSKKRALAKHEAVSKANEGIKRWNKENPSQPFKQLLAEPYIPTLNPTGIDVSRRLNEDLKGVDPRPLSVEEITECLGKLGPEKGFAWETFKP